MDGTVFVKWAGAAQDVTLSWKWCVEITWTMTEVWYIIHASVCLSHPWLSFESILSVCVFLFITEGQCLSICSRRLFHGKDPCARSYSRQKLYTCHTYHPTTWCHSLKKANRPNKRPQKDLTKVISSVVSFPLYLMTLSFTSEKTSNGFPNEKTSVPVKMYPSLFLS